MNLCAHLAIVRAHLDLEEHLKTLASSAHLVRNTARVHQPVMIDVTVPLHPTIFLHVSEIADKVFIAYVLLVKLKEALLILLAFVVINVLALGTRGAHGEAALLLVVEDNNLVQEHVRALTAKVTAAKLANATLTNAKALVIVSHRKYSTPVQQDALKHVKIAGLQFNVSRVAGKATFNAFVQMG